MGGVAAWQRFDIAFYPAHKIEWRLKRGKEDSGSR